MNKEKRISFSKLRFGIYLLLLAGILVLVSFYGGAFSYVLFFAALLYPVLSFAYILYIRAAMRIYQDMDVRLLHKQTEEPYQFIAENAGPLPIGGIRLYYDSEICGFSSDFTTHTLELLPHEKIEHKTGLLCRYAGSYVAGITEMSIGDSFGLYRIRFHFPTLLHVHVMPNITDTASDDLNRMIWNRVSAQMFQLKTPEDVRGNDFKIYETGDPISRIHWKNYARSGELSVRIPEQQNLNMPTVILETMEMDRTLDSIIRRDAYLEYVVSTAGYFAAQNKPVSFLYQDAKKEQIMVSDYESFNGFYAEISRDFRARAFSEEERAGFYAEAETNKGLILLLREEDCSLCQI